MPADRMQNLADLQHHVLALAKDHRIGEVGEGLRLRTIEPPAMTSGSAPERLPVVSPMPANSSMSSTFVATSS